MDILINLLIIVILIVGTVVCVYYWNWVEKAEAGKEKKKQEKNSIDEHIVPGSKEATQESIKNFFIFINPFQGFWHDVKLYVGLLSIILGCFYIILKLSV